MEASEALAEIRRLVAAELNGPRNVAAVKLMLWSAYWCRTTGSARRWMRCASSGGSGRSGGARACGWSSWSPDAGGPCRGGPGVAPSLSAGRTGLVARTGRFGPASRAWLQHRPQTGHRLRVPWAGRQFCQVPCQVGRFEDADHVVDLVGAVVAAQVAGAAVGGEYDLAEGLPAAAAGVGPGHAPSVR